MDNNNESSKILDKEGFYFGKDYATGADIIINPYGKKPSNNNWFILGSPGVGKTTVSKLILNNQYQKLGTKLIILDAEQEYRFNSVSQRKKVLSFGEKNDLPINLTNFDFDEDIIIFDVSNIIYAPENIRNAQIFSICSWILDQIFQKKDEKILIKVPESLFLDLKNPELIEIIQKISILCSLFSSSCSSGMIFDMFSVNDFEQPDYAKEIIDNSYYKFIMCTNGADRKRTKDYFNLNEEEYAFLGRGERGIGLLFTGESKRFAKIIYEKNK